MNESRQNSDEAPAAGPTAPSPDAALPPGYERREADINFAKPVTDNGYLWWYIDAISDDGQESATLIVFVGSVFSPYYASARRRGNQPAEAHCAFNTILYGPGSRKRWSMTERGQKQLKRDTHSYELGPSRIAWDGNTLLASIDEHSVPMPTRMRGTIRVTPSVLTEHTLVLDRNGRHRWHPLAPVARVEVDFPALDVSWSGDGYLDSNEGKEPLGEGFSGWDWTRARLSNGDCAVRYEARQAQQEPYRLALRFAADGSMISEKTAEPAPMATTTVWRMKRQMPGASPGDELLSTLEDTPFYARSLVDAQFGDERGRGFHESLDMQRFGRRWVQTLLPFRMPRLG